MPTYILLMTLTPEGRKMMMADSNSVFSAENKIDMPEVQMMGLYGVLGDYDFVSILEAPDNSAVARFSLELGVKAGVHIMSLPAIPISRLEGASPGGETEGDFTGITLGPPEGTPEEYLRRFEEPPTYGPP